jgi:hypothetical protein
MPDPTKQTISATQTAGLWNASPYITRWMLFKHFAHNMPIDSPESSRMKWGKALQPLVIAEVAKDLGFEIRPDDIYVRNGRLGCTRDAQIICPDRGPGALEIKCVFDLGVWMREWDGGKHVPRHHEIQLQQQMLVGDGATSYEWGVIAAWVCGEMHYFERKPVPKMWTKMRDDAEQFFADVADAKEPKAIGEVIEITWLTDLFRTDPEKVINIDDAKAAQLVCSYKNHGELRKFHEKAEADYKARLLAIAEDAGTVNFLHGITLKIRRSEVKGTTIERKPYVMKVLTPFVPKDLPDDLIPE